MGTPMLPVVVVGAGLAGLCTALHLADERRVIVVAKRALHEGATAWAQGGIVGVLGGVVSSNPIFFRQEPSFAGRNRCPRPEADDEHGV